MKMILVPGYTELFGESTQKYEDLIGKIPSEVIISVLITLNNELNAPLPDEKNQDRLRALVSERFSETDSNKLNTAYYRFIRKAQGAYRKDVFGRRYLLEMILKELNQFRSFEITDTTGEDEYNILLGYLLTIDEVNKKDYDLFKEAEQFKSDPLYEYRMLWTPNISQIEFSEKPNPIYELFRLLAFLRFALQNFKSYLTEYTRSFGFKNISQLIGSINQIVQTTLQYRENEILKKLTYIVPNELLDNSHLNSQSVNNIIGTKEKIWLADLRKFPLFDNKRNGYMVIDEDIYKKKAYKGPFFELYYNTTLQKNKSFNTYSTEISSGVLEQLCFQNILKAFPKREHDVLHFDDASESVPDCYFRHNKSIILIEFKGYLFRDDLSANPNFDNIKQYIDERFVANEKGKAKGVGQILNQLTLLKDNKYDFDTDFKNKLHQKSIVIYPVIVHAEFHFSMPGISEYLNEILQSKIDEETKNHFEIKPLVLINLEVLFHFLFHQGNFLKLIELIGRYYKILQSRKQFLTKQPGIDSFLRSKSSFDEIYRSILLAEIEKVHKTADSPIDLVEIVGITQEELDEVL